MSATLFRKSAVFSLIVQVVTGVIAAQAIFIKLPAEHQILTSVITMETIVQLIEFVFYIWVTMTSLEVSSITSRRYIDWSITTPTMLLSTIFYFEYLKHMEAKKQTQAGPEWPNITAREVVRNNSWAIAITLISNWLMLISGVLGELGVTPLLGSNMVGFVFFGITFYNIYKFSGNPGQHLFMFLLIVWSMYGVVAMLPAIWKNIAYNLLDIVAKNFYGIYIWLQIRKIAAANPVV